MGIGRGLLLWPIGIPIPLIILLAISCITERRRNMSIGTIILIILIIALLGGFSGVAAVRFTAPAITAAVASAW